MTDHNKDILDIFNADIDKPQEITDPSILAQLNASAPKEVTDPALLAQLNGEGKDSGIQSQIGNDWNSRLNNAKEALFKSAIGQQSIMSGMLQTAGQAAGAVTDPVTEVAKNAWGNIPQKIANYADTTDIGQGIGNALLKGRDIADTVTSKNPEAFGDVGALLNMAGAEGTISAGRAAAGKLGQIASNSIDEAKAANMAAKPMPYDPIATHSAISDAYGAAKTGTRPYYNLMNEIASGETADASSLKPALDSMIADIQNTPFHEATSELPYLKSQAAKIGDSGTIPLQDMIKLNQNLNSNFNPKRFAEGTDTPYVKVSGIVNDSLKDAAQRIPEFGDAKLLADKNWLNTVKSPFEDNTVLQKFWKPEDYYAKRGVDSGMLENLPDPTLQRAQTMLKGIKTPVQLDAIRRVLPQDIADQLSQAKIEHITQGEGVGRLGAAGQVFTKGLDLTPTGIANTGRNIANVISPRYTPEQMDLLAAAKQPSPTLSTKYQKPYAALKASVQQQRDLAGEMQPMNYAPKEPPRLALPAPTTINYTNAYGQTVPLTSAGREIIGQSPSTAAEKASGRSIEEDQAWEGHKRQLADERQQAVNEVYDKLEAQKEVERQSIRGRTIQQDYDERTEPYYETEMARKLREAGFAKGGVVKNREKHLTKKIADKLGREPTAKEVYFANIVGAHGIHRLYGQKEKKIPAHKMFPKTTVSKNMAFFYNGKEPYTVEEVRAALG